MHTFHDGLRAENSFRAKTRLIFEFFFYPFFSLFSSRVSFSLRFTTASQAMTTASAVYILYAATAWRRRRRILRPPPACAALTLVHTIISGSATLAERPGE